MLSGEPTIADAADMGHLGARNREGVDRLLVKILRNAREGALGGHGLAIIAIEHRTPRIGVSIARRRADHREADRVWILNEAHVMWRMAGAMEAESLFDVDRQFSGAVFLFPDLEHFRGVLLHRAFLAHMFEQFRQPAFAEAHMLGLIRNIITDELFA